MVLRHRSLALRDLHAQACALADEEGTPFQPQVHTGQAILCGDFNFEPSAPEYATIQQPLSHLDLYGKAQTAIINKANHWRDAWPLVHAQAPHAPTFPLFDRTYGPQPITCDFVFVSDRLAHRVQGLAVNLGTQVSDHQPVLLELG